MSKVDKKVPGINIPEHPLEPYRKIIEAGNYRKFDELENLEIDNTYSFAGVITAVHKKWLKRQGIPFAIIDVKDFSGCMDIMVWSDQYPNFSNSLKEGSVLNFIAKVSWFDDILPERLVLTDLKPIQCGGSDDYNRRK